LLDDAGDEFVERSPAPGWPVPPDGAKIASNLRALASGETSAALRRALHIELARLCFSFAAFNASAELFEQVRIESLLENEDRIAYLYAHERLNRLGNEAVSIVEPAVTNSRNPIDPNWRMLETVIATVTSNASAAARATEEALGGSL